MLHVHYTESTGNGVEAGIGVGQEFSIGFAKRDRRIVALGESNHGRGEVDPLGSVTAGSASGNHVVRVTFAYDGGGTGKGATATLLVDEKQVGQGRIPQTIAVRFSLDETFDIGEDTGTPVLEDYADQMPFRFTGTLKRFVVVLEPMKLSDEERNRLRGELAKAMMAVH
jgi:hypothetical protein